MAEAPLQHSRSRTTIFLAHAAGFLFVVAAAYWLRRISIEPDPLLQGYLQIVSGLLAFVFAAVTLVRFQGTQDRISLILGAGFLLSGAVLTATSVLFFQFLPDAPLRLLWAPIAWWIGRMVLALLLIVALLVERFIPRSRHPRREIAGALLTVIALTYALAATLRRLPPEVSPHPGASDPLTGLANYRHLLHVLENETERTNRSGRPFSVLLLDLDDLKKINDNYGHLVGSRAICRLGHVLRIHCRTIDTAARYGGDEFALVLPEAQEDEASRRDSRIREVLANDDEQPPLSASIGISVYRGDGERIEKLLSEADRDLYSEKARRGRRAVAASHSRR